jgi:uridylate kinase
MAAYDRILLKLSGEAFGGGAVGVDPDIIAGIADEIAEIVAAAPRWPS